MTLRNFKSRIRNGFLVLVFLSYSVFIFQMGRIVSNGKFIKLKFKSTKNEIAQPIKFNAPYADSQSTKVISSFVKLCSNTVYSFEVAYPKDWFTTYNTDNQKCNYFAPYSFVIPQNIEYPFVPVKVEVIPKEKWLQTVKFYQNPNDFQNVISSQNIQINDKSVTKVKAETTAGSALSRGLKILSYLVFDGNTPLVFSYQQLDEKGNPDLYENILEQMVSSLKFF